MMHSPALDFNTSSETIVHITKGNLLTQKYHKYGFRKKNKNLIGLKSTTLWQTVSFHKLPKFNPNSDISLSPKLDSIFNCTINLITEY